MKKLVLILTLTVFTTSITQAQSCQSAFSGLQKVFNNMVEDYIDFRKTAAKAFVEIIIPGKDGAKTELKKLVDNMAQLQINAYQAQGIVAGQGRGKIGPRYLIAPTKKVTGKLVPGGTERTFIISNNAYDKLFVTVTKTGGKAGAKIAVCTKYNNGSHHNEKRKEIPTGKNSDGTSRRLVFFGMGEDKYTSIHIVKTGLLTDNFEYYVTVEGEFNEDKMKDEYESDKSNKKKPASMIISNGSSSAIQKSQKEIKKPQE